MATTIHSLSPAHREPPAHRSASGALFSPTTAAVASGTCPESRVNLRNINVDESIPAPRVSSTTADLRQPRQATNLGRSILFAIATSCVGAVVGACATLAFWSGLKDRFEEGVSATADGTANATGGVNANGNFEANGQAGVDDLRGDVIGVKFGVPASGQAQYDADGNLVFDGGFDANGVDLDFDGDATIGIGSVAPWKVVTTVAAVFGVVVGAFGWLIERQLSAAADRRAMIERQDVLLQQSQNHTI